MNSLNLVIPTMWKEQQILDYLAAYCLSNYVAKIILIDNNPRERPKSDLYNHPKVEFVCYGKNIYVNPSWNEGYLRSASDIVCMLNDDLFIEDSVFEFVCGTDFTNIDMIGMALRGTEDNYNVDQSFYTDTGIEKLAVDRNRPIGGQAWAFGTCMFIKRSSYRIIPSLFKIWYGDDYLAHRLANIYVLKSNKIRGEISKTLTAPDLNKDLNSRILQDSYNVYRFGKFVNGHNWSFPKQAATQFNQKYHNTIL